MGKKFYLILEWADGGSLRNFWNKPDKPDLSTNLIAAVLKQLHGLAGALEKLHNDIDVSKVRADVSGNWRHGDLKPENILMFNTKADPTGLGTLQIADLGLAKYHEEATQNRDGPTGMRHGTVKYEGPEAHPQSAKMKDPRSRRYDLWSMGCIMFEFVIWLLHGNNGLQDFHKQAEDTGLVEGSGERDFFATAFYKFRNGNFEVNDVVEHWITMVQRHDPEFKDGKRTALSDLLQFVKKRLLIVDNGEDHMNSEDGLSQKGGDGSPRFRASASDLKKELANMVERGRANEHYLFTGTDRKNVSVPSKAKTFGPRLTASNAQALPVDRKPSEDTPPYTETSFIVPDYSHVGSGVQN